MVFFVVVVVVFVLRVLAVATAVPKPVAAGFTHWERREGESLPAGAARLHLVFLSGYFGYFGSG
jgi:hypothetical protein